MGRLERVSVVVPYGQSTYVDGTCVGGLVNVPTSTREIFLVGVVLTVGSIQSDNPWGLVPIPEVMVFDRDPSNPSLVDGSTVSLSVDAPVMFWRLADWMVGPNWAVSRGEVRDELAPFRTALPLDLVDGQIRLVLVVFSPFSLTLSGQLVMTVTWCSFDS